MGKYQNGIETRDRILQACRELFYKDSYDSTTFRDISEYTGVRQSAIHYHFGTKDNILKEIYKETIEDNNAIVEECSDEDTCFLAKTFFDLEIYLYKVWKDGKYRRFYKDATRFWYSSELFTIEDPGKMSYNAYSDEKGGVDFFARMACVAFDQFVLQYIDDHIEEVDFKTVYSQTVNIYRRLLQIDEKEFDHALEQLKILEGRCRWEDIKTTL